MKSLLRGSSEQVDESLDSIEGLIQQLHKGVNIVDSLQGNSMKTSSLELTFKKDTPGCDDYSNSLHDHQVK